MGSHGGGGDPGGPWGPLDQRSWATHHPGRCSGLGGPAWCLCWSCWSRHPGGCPSLQLAEKSTRGEETQLWGEAVLGAAYFPKLQEADTGDHPGQGFPLSEEVAEPNGVKAAARGRRRFVSDQREQRPLGGGISGEENPAEHEHGGDPGSERDKRGSGLRGQ